MGFIEYSLDRIHREIPEMILNLAFGVTVWEYQSNRISLDARIRSEVIHGIVVPDCNIVGGEIVTIPLYNCEWEYLPYGVRITIPLSETHHRYISAILSVEMVNRTLEPYQLTEGHPAPTGSPEVYLVAPNVIFLPINPINRFAHVRCTLENDPNLANYSQKAQYDLAELSVRAAKALIHNKLRMSVTITASTGGNVDGRIREVVDGYADAWEQYREFLKTKFRKITLMDNREWHQRLIRMGVGG